MEENKVATRERLKIVLDAYDGNTDKQADALLHSPELLVTLAKPRFRAIGSEVLDCNTIIAKFYSPPLVSAIRAERYAEWLNGDDHD